MAANHCIVLFANRTGWYRKGAARLIRSLENRFDGKVLAYADERQIGAPPHEENPYAFKLFCFMKALEAGFTKILYLDCSVWAINNVKPAFDIIENQGYLMQDSEYYLKDWINDEALNYFGISRSALDGTRVYGVAGMLGLNFNNRKAHDFFDKWHDAMVHGAFKGSWDNHRHDQACGSMIAWLTHMQYQPKDSILKCAPEDYPVNSTLVFKANGM